MEYISEIFIEEISKRASSSMQAAGVWGAIGAGIGTYKSMHDKKNAREELGRLHDTLSKAKDPAVKQYLSDKIARLTKVSKQSTFKNAAKSAAVMGGVGAIDGAVYGSH